MAWLKKPTWRLAIVYSLLAALIYTARRPSPLSMTLGLLPIVAGLALRVWACGHLVKNKRLTTTGPYAYVKNPLYVGTILITTGFCVLAQPLLVPIVFIGFYAYYMPRKRKIEGDRLRKIYGEAYERFEKAVPDLLPQLTPYRSGDTTRFDGKLVFDNSEHGTVMSVALGIALIFVSVWLRESGSLPAPWWAPTDYLPLIPRHLPGL
ncbi:MAG: isoprenylcysteine carboxylmethyltransferase family protein [Acidobacteria bacterium]|nr:isoprenylcysteine carboxylmethyltransferase family protein [Acidobacteriota bacterium]